MAENIIKPLTEEQITEAAKASQESNFYSNVLDSISNALNSDANSENRIIDPEYMEYLYPELWQTIVKNCSDLIREHNNRLLQIMLKTIKKCIKEDIEYPIKSREEINRDDCRLEEMKSMLFTSYGKINIKEKYHNIYYTSVINDIFNDIERQNDFNNNVVNIVKSTIINNEYIKSIIDNGFITDSEYTTFIQKITPETSNAVHNSVYKDLSGLDLIIIIDFVLRLFEFDNKLTYYQLLESKYHYIYVLSTGMEAKKISNAKKSNNDNKVTPLFKGDN